MHFFLAGELEPGEQSLDETERLSVHEVELDSLVDELFNGTVGEARVVDNKTHLALVHTALLRSRGEGAGGGGGA